ncbi:MAG: ATP-binding protein [Verrucomicrobia bacterium]|nr:ATP-binding protein [Verrucomicrobiota bacterium]
MARGKSTLRVLLLLGAAAVVLRAAPGDPAEPLTTAAAVLSLTADQASRQLKVAVSGVVTAAEPDWKGQFFVQDATGGVFVENLGRPAPAPGEMVAVAGISHPGAFAPIISAPQWRVTGTAPLPEAKQVLVENLEAGVEDGLRVEVTGWVRTARIEDGRLALQLALGGYRLEVFARLPDDLPPDRLVAARVRVRGTTATHYNTAMRQLTSVAVYVPRVEDFTVLARETESPFAQPAIPVNNVAQYRRGSRSDQRVHIRGTVTLQRVGAEIFVQDESGGIRLETTQPDRFAAGETIDAAGFLAFDNHLPILRDAELRRAADQRPAPAPVAVAAAEILRGRHHGSLVTLRGRILDRTTRPVARPAVRFAGVETTWLLQDGDLTFTLEHEAKAEDPALAAIPIGSVIAADGVCVAAADALGRITSFKLRLAAPAALRVMARPSWWTPGRLAAGVGLLSVVLLAVVVWLLTVAKKNAALRELIREREQAQRLLQEAHDTLEEKVIERSAQLQTEMTARKTAEVQFKAVLAERTRLARDLHDTLEQTLTGIALHLDTSAKLAPRDPTVAGDHLQLARNWLRQSQVELRHSIWDLRSRELEQFDLAGALRRSAEQVADGTALAVEFQTTGERRTLPEIVEENVLRIGQEALTNIAKHARATRVRLALEFSARALVLRVEDDGAGFTPSAAPPAGEGHFGLLGMAERAKRLAGGLKINSSPGRGTAIVVEIPLEPEAAPAAVRSP